MSQNNFQDYIDDFDRKSSGAGSHKDKDRFSAEDIRVMFSERGDLSKAKGAQMVLDYADQAGDSGSSMGGGSERELDKLRGYLNEKPKNNEPTVNFETDQPPEFDYSPRVAHAKARLAQHKEDIFSGKLVDNFRGVNSNKDASDNFLNRYMLKLGKPDENGNYQFSQ